MHTTRQWMVTHEWMLKSNRQTEWIDYKGLFLWLAFYCGGLGGGLYLISLFFNNFWGMVAGWGIVAVFKGAFHMADLGQPTRFWRLLMNAKTSWLSRGLLFTVAFIGFGFIQLVVTYFFGGAAIEVGLKLAAGVSAVLVMGYMGFVLMKMKGMPLWDISFLPLIYISCGALGGFGVTEAIALFTGNMDFNLMEMISRWLLTCTALLLLAYLIVVSQKGDASKRSQFFKAKNKVSKALVVMVITLGIVLPLAIAIDSYFVEATNSIVLIMAIICEIASGLVVGFYLLKSGVYSPLLSTEQHMMYKYAPGQAKAVETNQWLPEKIG